jgi:alpha-ketoglutarate-dependent taurine dioxygenase
MSELEFSARPVPRRGKAKAIVSVHAEWSGRALPALVRANAHGIDLARWIEQNSDWVDTLARRAGAVLLRGFAVAYPEDFAAVMSALSDDVLRYGERSSPRNEVAPGVYTSTDHPADQTILLHNEQSYTLNWPLRIVFFCEVEPDQGGRTPLADSRRVLSRLSQSTVERFETQGIRYVRNYLTGISLPWQEAFGTDRRADVKAYCRRNLIDLEWIGADGLRTSQVRPAVRIHPTTGERTWFNHGLFFHVTSLSAEVSSGLRSALAEEDLPYNTYFGDGSPIPDELLAELRAAYRAETTGFDWQRGDVLLIENMLVAHGREPFSGGRRILTAMADSILAGEAG